MKDLFGDDVKDSSTKDFASLFEESINQKTKRFERGDRVTGEVLTIGKEEIFLSISGKDSVLFKKDLTDEKIAEIEVGQSLNVYIVKPSQHEVMVVSLKPSSKALAEGLEDAFDLETPVDGKVTEAVNGGYRVQLAGGKLAFCPFSQIDLRSSQDPEQYLEKKFEFIITKYEGGGRNIVVSRRKALEALRLESEGNFLAEVQEGSLLMGTVTRLETYGAFVELQPGIEGLVHISEVAWGHMRHPSEGIQVGQSLQFKVLKVEEDAKGRLRISLSRKQAEGDPWETVSNDFTVGQVAQGILRGKERFGYFVELKPGVRALLPKAALRESDLEKQFEKKELGEKVNVVIDRIDLAEKRISLVLPKSDEDLAWQSFDKKAQSIGTLGDQFKTLFKK